jgi:hypothetical protein
MRKSQQQERGKKKQTNKQTQKKELTKMLEEKRTTPHPQTLRNASHHALSLAVRTHTTNEQAKIYPLSFLYFFRDRSLLSPPVFGHPGKKKKNPRARSHSRNALAGSKRQGGRWWWGALWPLLLLERNPKRTKSLPKFPTRKIFSSSRFPLIMRRRSKL